MNVKYVGNFVKNYKRRIQSYPNLKKRFLERLNLFLQFPDNPILKDHQLKGEKKSLRAFSVTGDIRIIYFTRGDDLYLVDIGTHNQVY